MRPLRDEEDDVSYLTLVVAFTYASALHVLRIEFMCYHPSFNYNRTLLARDRLQQTPFYRPHRNLPVVVTVIFLSLLRTIVMTVCF